MNSPATHDEKDIEEFAELGSRVFADTYPTHAAALKGLESEIKAEMKRDLKENAAKDVLHMSPLKYVISFVKNTAKYASLIATLATAPLAPAATTTDIEPTPLELQERDAVSGDLAEYAVKSYFKLFPEQDGYYDREKMVADLRETFKESSTDYERQHPVGCVAKCLENDPTKYRLEERVRPYMAEHTHYEVVETPYEELPTFEPPPQPDHVVTPAGDGQHFIVEPTAEELKNGVLPNFEIPSLTGLQFVPDPAPAVEPVPIERAGLQSDPAPVERELAGLPTEIPLMKTHKMVDKALDNYFRVNASRITAENFKDHIGFAVQSIKTHPVYGGKKFDEMFHGSFGGKSGQAHVIAKLEQLKLAMQKAEREQER